MTKPAILTLILAILTACATPPLQPPPAAVSNIAAAATQTVYANRSQMTAAAATTTRSALIAGQQTAIAGTAVAMMATREVAGTSTAVVVRTAVSFQQDRRQIENDALGTRMALGTNATRSALTLAMTERREASDRLRVTAVVAWLLAGAFLTGIGTAFVKILHRDAATIRDKDGSVVSIGGRLILPEMELEEPEPQPRRTARMQGGDAPPLDKDLPSFRLVDDDRVTVYEFSGSGLNRMIANIQQGDLGFRRESSRAGKGLDRLIGLADTATYTRIVECMLDRGWIEQRGTGHVWTYRGMTDMLKMRTFPR